MSYKVIALLLFVYCLIDNMVSFCHGACIEKIEFSFGEVQHLLKKVPFENLDVSIRDQLERTKFSVRRAEGSFMLCMPEEEAEKLLGWTVSQSTTVQKEEAAYDLNKENVIGGYYQSNLECYYRNQKKPYLYAGMVTTASCFLINILSGSVLSYSSGVGVISLLVLACMRQGAISRNRDIFEKEAKTKSEARWEEDRKKIVKNYEKQAQKHVAAFNILKEFIKKESDDPNDDIRTGDLWVDSTELATLLLPHLLPSEAESGPLSGENSQIADRVSAIQALDDSSSSGTATGLLKRLLLNSSTKWELSVRFESRNAEDVVWIDDALFYTYKGVDKSGLHENCLSPVSRKVQAELSARCYNNDNNKSGDKKPKGSWYAILYNGKRKGRVGVC